MKTIVDDGDRLTPTIVCAMWCGAARQCFAQRRVQQVAIGHSAFTLGQVAAESPSSLLVGELKLLSSSLIVWKS